MDILFFMETNISLLMDRMLTSTYLSIIVEAKYGKMKMGVIYRSSEVDGVSHTIHSRKEVAIFAWSETAGD